MSRKPEITLILSSLFLMVGCSARQPCAETAPSVVGSAPTAAEPFRPDIDEEVARLFTHPSPEGEVPWGFEWSPDGARLIYTRLAGEGDQYHFQLWLVDAESGREQVIWDRPNRSVSQNLWLPDGQRLLLSTGAELSHSPSPAFAPGVSSPTSSSRPTEVGQGTSTATTSTL
jgi:dipeptidyl aminopeptidase/acylaminoacyl peptidase